MYAALPIIFDFVHNDAWLKLIFIAEIYCK